ncbi:MAG: hypothetical protein AB2L24_29475 [Mangrovibacterium sp.]
MARQKSPYTVRKAVEIAFEEMENEFLSVRLCQRARELTERKYLLGGTILRRLREARNEEPKKFGYIVEKSGLYHKKVSE